MEKWTVERKFSEFYALETKLTMFHGNLSVRLPPAGMFPFGLGQKTFEFMESRRQSLEDYLSALLSLPDLAGFVVQSGVQMQD